MDAYRFLVHNYSSGDEIYLFGFSRGAYTMRSLCGLINNCGLLQTKHAKLIEAAFELYKNKKHEAKSAHAKRWRKESAVPDSQKIHFVGVWDTVGALELPSSVFGFIKDKHLFYDRKLGSNISRACHALSLDERRVTSSPRSGSRGLRWS